MICNDSTIDPRQCCLERRPDGAIVVRVPSRRAGVPALPDAVFAFRAGDPQFAFWQQQLTQLQPTGH
jgi:hypothetical protein